MRKFFSGLSIRIWRPFAISLVLAISFLAFYYPHQQGVLYRKAAERNLEEVVRVLALQIESSLEDQDFRKLSRSIEVAKQTHAFEFIAIVEKKDSSDEFSVFASNPANLAPEIIFTKDSSKYITKEENLKIDGFEGYVSIAVSNEKVNQEIQEINRPVYSILLLILIFSLIAFIAFARVLSKPIVRLTHAANELRLGNYSVLINEKSKTTEIFDLNNALFQLREALIQANKQNLEFNSQLEEKIALRTQELEVTHSRLIEAQEVASIGNYEVNIKTGEWFASRMIYRIFDIPDGFPLVNNAWTGLLSDTNKVIVESLMKDSLSSGKPFKRDLRIKPLGNSGEDRWVLISGKPISDLDGEVNIIRGTIQDITERKNAESEIKQLSLFAQRTSNCVIITDQNRNILWVNESTIKLTGYSNDELIGQTPRLFQFEKTNQQTVNFIREKLSRLEEVSAELLNRSKNGKEYWLSINIVPLFDDSNCHIGFMAVESDISERVKLEQEIREREENYRIILENSSEMIHTIDNNGKLIWANRSWKEKLGVANIPVEGLSLTEFLSEDTLREFDRVIPKLMEGDIVTDLDCLFLSREGTSLTLQGRAIPVIENGVVIGSQAYLHDITRIKKAENDLKLLLDLTQKQNERLRNFTHIVSHNLRSHTANLSSLIMLMESELPDFKANDYFSNFNKAVTSLMDVIHHLSKVAHIQMGEGKDFIAIDVNKSIDKAIATVFGIAENAGVNILFEKNGDYYIRGSEAYIDSIILNLLTNAIKYRSEKHEPYIRIMVSSFQDLVQIDVIDNGLGIDLELQGRKIFGMYKTFHKHPDSRGVGLFMVKNQVEAMDGKIEVKSKVDVGSTFSIYFKNLDLS